jgi:YidC/Oxa1 family membrane protein insertase
MGLFREFAELWRFRFSTPPEQRTLIFYSEHESYYAYFEGLVEALKADRELRFCYVTSDPADPILSADIPEIHTFYLDKLLPLFMSLVDCRVMVMTVTDLNQVHLRRSINPVHYVYVFHAMNSIHMTYRHGAFDHYDSIFCTGPHHVRELTQEGELRPIRQRHLVEAGYSRVERIHADWQKRAVEGPQPERTALVAPSWSAGNILDEHGVALVRQLLAANFRVILRPHPETHKRFPELVERLQSTFAQENRFELEHSVRTDTSLLEADVLITDWSGIALEYAFGTERPLIYIDVPRKIHNEHYEELGIEPFEVAMREELGVVVAPQDLLSIAEIANRLVLQRDQYGEKIRRLRSEHVFNFGRSSEIGARYIGDLLAITSNQGD